MTVLWLVIALAWVAALTVMVALCRAAAIGDRQAVNQQRERDSDDGEVAA